MKLFKPLSMLIFGMILMFAFTADSWGQCGSSGRAGLFGRRAAVQGGGGCSGGGAEAMSFQMVPMTAQYQYAPGLPQYAPQTINPVTQYQLIPSDTNAVRFAPIGAPGSRTFRCVGGVCTPVSAEQVPMPQPDYLKGPDPLKSAIARLQATISEADAVAMATNALMSADAVYIAVYIDP